MLGILDTRLPSGGEQQQAHVYGTEMCTSYSAQKANYTGTGVVGDMIIIFSIIAGYHLISYF